MRESKHLYTAFAFMLILAVSAKAQMSPQQLGENLDKRFAHLVAQKDPGSAIAVVKDHEIIFNKGFGLANLEHQIPISQNTVFDLASLSKQFTGYAIALLIEQEKIQAEDDIRTYIPELPDFGEIITIDHLLHHTSGIRDWTSTLPLAGWSFDDVISFDQILRMTYRQAALNFTPGSEYLYSNTGYNLLAELIERVGGMDFPEWMDEHIFTPLGMGNSFFLADHSEVIANRASGYSKDSENEFRISPNNLTAWGSSSMYSTSSDLGRWVMHLLDPPEDKAKVVNRMFQPGEFNDGTENPYAYGIGVGEFRSQKSMSHSGSWASFSTYLTLLPESGLGIIVLCNHANSASAIAQEISSLFVEGAEAGKDDAPKVDGGFTVSKEILGRYQGTYKLGPGWYVELTLKDGILWTQATGEGIFPMMAMTDTSFMVPSYGMRTMTFYQDENDVVAGLEYNGMTCPKMKMISEAGKMDFADLVGEYYSEELMTSYTVQEVDGNLQLWHFRHGDFTLTPAYGYEFGGPNWYLKAVEFFNDEQGDGFRVYSYRARDQVFRKVE